MEDYSSQKELNKSLTEKVKELTRKTEELAIENKRVSHILVTMQLAESPVQKEDRYKPELEKREKEIVQFKQQIINKDETIKSLTISFEQRKQRAEGLEEELEYRVGEVNKLRSSLAEV